MVKAYNHRTFIINISLKYIYRPEATQKQSNRQLCINAATWVSPTHTTSGGLAYETLLH